MWRVERAGGCSGAWTVVAGGAGGLCRIWLTSFGTVARINIKGEPLIRPTLRDLDPVVARLRRRTFHGAGPEAGPARRAYCMALAALLNDAGAPP